MPIGRDSSRTGTNKEVCTYVEFRDSNLGTYSRKGKRIEDRGGLGFKGDNLGNNVLTEEIKKGKDRHHKRKTPPLALRCYYCRK